MTKNNEVAVVQQKSNQLALRPELQDDFVNPVADIYEQNDAYVVAIDMPGMTKDDVSISLESGALVVKGTVHPYHRDNATMLYNELVQGKTYYRVFNLGSGINRDAVEAQYEHGVLMVKLWKNDELKARVIPIK